MNFKTVKTKGKVFLDTWNQAQVGTYGAAVAYCTVFSLAPLLVIAISIAGLFLGSGKVQDSVLRQFESAFGASGAEMVGSLIAHREPATVSILSAIFGFVLVLFGAMGIFSALRSALDRIFEPLPEKGKQSIWQTIRKNLVSVGMVLSLGFALIVSLAASALLAALGGTLDRYLAGAHILAALVEFVMSFAILAAFMTLMLKHLPSKRIPWRPAIAGGIMAALLFVIGKYLLGLYFDFSKVGEAYGAASSLVLLILWTCYMSQAFFLSAIVAKLYFMKK